MEYDIRIHDIVGNFFHRVCVCVLKFNTVRFEDCPFSRLDSSSELVLIIIIFTVIDRGLESS
jgi:hypothetical protein